MKYKFDGSEFVINLNAVGRRRRLYIISFLSFRPVDVSITLYAAYVLYKIDNECHMVGSEKQKGATSCYYYNNSDVNNNKS